MRMIYSAQSYAIKVHLTKLKFDSNLDIDTVIVVAVVVSIVAVSFHRCDL